MYFRCDLCELISEESCEQITRGLAFVGATGSWMLVGMQQLLAHSPETLHITLSVLELSWRSEQDGIS